VVDTYNNLKKEFKINKSFLMGNSYGGYLALKTLYEYPNLFEGAISINGVVDWYDLIKNNPKSIFRIHFNGPPSKKNIYLYDQASIFLNKKNLKNKKVLIINGNNDTTIPARQKKLFINYYKNIAKITDYSFDEGHVLQKQQTFDQILSLILSFTKI
jgi:dipeptidyl aminopeptidase/acylaminoacyl peptidase